MVLVPEHWYLVELNLDDGTVLKTVIQFVGVNIETNQPTFVGYEHDAEVDSLRVIKEVHEG